MIVRRATLDDLYNYEGAAELIDGQIVDLGMTGRIPSRVARNILIPLQLYCEKVGRGEALMDNLGFAVPMLTSGRQSFAPDVAYTTLPPAENDMRFVEGAPEFAVEVRSENDYGSAAEERMSAKRSDYFEAGTLVVWDVDPEAETVAIFTVDSPDQPRVVGRGATANAEPVVPGWRIAVDDVFRRPSRGSFRAADRGGEP